MQARGDAQVAGVELPRLSWQDLPELPGAMLKMAVAGDKRVRLIRFEGGFTEIDWCLTGHTMYVISGSLQTQTRDELHTWREGTVFVVPDGVLHRSSNPGAHTTVVLCIDNAPRNIEP